ESASPLCRETASCLASSLYENWFCNSHERISVQSSHPPVARESEAKTSRFGTENLFSNQSTNMGTFATDKLYFDP
ncbi:hypothetical protein, partial [Hymenobacter saemangeumensis]|uniref:hypothetical protein n=1 Tax=Hymenobacter saemangeumensis TaxID=1084522 RepID=UPI0031E5BA20